MTVNYEERAKGEYEAWFTQVLRAIGPCVQSALNVSRYLHKQAHEVTLGNLTNAISGPALVVTHSLRISTANERGFQWLGDKGLLGRSLSSLPAAGALRDAFAATWIPGRPSTIDVSLRIAGGPCRASVIRLTDTMSLGLKMQPLLSSEPCCLVIIREDEPDIPTVVARHFGLTKREERLIRHLAQGHSLKDIADLMGIARETVRTHLKSIFSKTGTSRQAELAIMLSKGL